MLCKYAIVSNIRMQGILSRAMRVSYAFEYKDSFWGVESRKKNNIPHTIQAKDSENSPSFKVQNEVIRFEF